MKNSSLTLLVGLFVIIGAGALLFMSVSIGGASISQSGQYSLVARFDSASGLKEGAFVEVAGVRVGKATSIEFDPQLFQAVVVIALDDAVEVPDDSIAAIRTAGIIGDRFIKIIPGGSDLFLEEGEEIIETESSISLEELVSKYMFSQE